MRPSVNQVLSGVTGIIQNVLLVDLTTESSKASAMEVISALNQLEVRWQNVIPNLMEENDDLVRLFTESLPVVKGLEQQSAIPTEKLRQKIEYRLKSPPPPERYPVYSHLEKENDDLRAMLVELIMVLAGAECAQPKEEFGELHRRIDVHLRKYLDREMQWAAAKAYRRP